MKTPIQKAKQKQKIKKVMELDEKDGLYEAMPGICQRCKRKEVLRDGLCYGCKCLTDKK